mmetsp:Transcript_11098/g.15615  ORF Transcript_11098/g.15615 Transcript_11098/m.15615 type:complete len:118 (-) Transcript_11098:562-915(-)
MFTSMGVPTLAMVENMAYFEVRGGDNLLKHTLLFLHTSCRYLFAFLNFIYTSVKAGENIILLENIRKNFLALLQISRVAMFIKCLSPLMLTKQMIKDLHYASVDLLFLLTNYRYLNP